MSDLRPYSPSPALHLPTFRLAHLSDLHLSGEADEQGMVMLAESEPLLEAAVRQINVLPDLDAVLVTGDLIDDGTPARLDAAIAALNRLRAPWFAIPGNHDIAHRPELGLLTRWSFFGQLQAGAPRGVTIYAGAAERGSWTTVLKPGVRLIGLDSNIPGDWAGQVDAAQLDWLEEVLDAAQEPLVVLLVHHPLHQVFDGWRHLTFGGQSWHKFFCYNGPEVLGLLDYYPQVRLVLTGHVHVAQIAREASRVHVSAPALDSYPLAYRVLEGGPTAAGWRCAWHSASPAGPAMLDRAHTQLTGTALARSYDPHDPGRFAAVSAGNASDQEGSLDLLLDIPDPDA